MYSVKRGNKFHFFALLFFILGEIILQITLEILDLDLTIVGSLLVSQLGLVFIPVILYFIITKSSIKKTLLFNKIDLTNIVLCIILTYLVMPLLSLANVISQFFVTNYISESINSTASLPLWVLIICMGVFPAVFEELSSRAIIVSNYKNKSWITTCLVSGLFFGILHMNLNQFSYAFIMGAIECFVVLITGSIFSSMLMHFVINGSNILLSRSIQSGLSDEIANTTITNSDLFMSLIAVLIICAITLPLAGLVINKLVVHNNKLDILKKDTLTKELLNLSEDFEQSNLEEEKVMTPFFLASVSTFIFIVVLFEIIIPIYS